LDLGRSENIIQQKSFDFALKIIDLVRLLEKVEKEFVISKQLMRSGTAIGALIREAEHAESKKDFIHKMSIFLKEAHETRYWLDLIAKSQLLDGEQLGILQKDSVELICILVSIVKSSKNSL